MGRDHEQVLANVDRGARVQRDSEGLARGIATEGDPTRPHRVQHANGKACHHALPCAREAALRDADGRLLPQQLVVRKVDAVTCGEREVGHRNNCPLYLHGRVPALDPGHVSSSR